MCDQVATEKSHLKVHVDSVYLKKKYKCRMCDYAAINNVISKAMLNLLI